MFLQFILLPITIYHPDHRPLQNGHLSLHPDTPIHRLNQAQTNTPISSAFDHPAAGENPFRHPRRRRSLQPHNERHPPGHSFTLIPSRIRSPSPFSQTGTSSTSCVFDTPTNIKHTSLPQDLRFCPYPYRTAEIYPRYRYTYAPIPPSEKDGTKPEKGRGGARTRMRS